MIDRTNSDGFDEMTAAAGVPTDEDDSAPRIRLDPDLNRVAKRLGEVAGRLELFDLNEELVWFDHLGRRKVMTGKTFRTWINEHVVLITDRGSCGTLKGEDAATVISSLSFLRGVRTLAGMNRVRLPVIRGDGTLELLPWGYDRQTQHFTVHGGLDYPVDMKLEEAVAWFGEVFGDFPFNDPRSMAVQIGAMLALYVKHLPGGGGLRPGFLWLANKPGSGKSVLAKAVLYAVLGHAAVAKMKRAEELDKELEAFCRAAAPYIFLDNVYGGIASSSIDQMMTSEESTGRAMGGHGTFMARNTALLLVTGNQLELNDDAARRFLVVDLFEKGDPEARKVRHPLTDTVMRSEEWRRKTLAALYAMVRHWHEQGMPRPDRVLPSFEEYALVLGGIVKAAGYGEVFEPAEIPDAISPEKAEFFELLRLVVADMRATVPPWDEEDEFATPPPPGVTEKEYTVQDLVVFSRLAGLFTDTVGTVDDGKHLHAKREGLTGDARKYAQDHGDLTSSAASTYGKLLAKHVGTEPEVDGVKVQFGRRSQHKKRIFTVKIIGDAKK